MHSSTHDPDIRERVPDISTRLGLARYALHSAEWLLLLTAVAYFTLQILPRAWERLNTDFPNYYIAAHLVREGASTSRLYEWSEAQRQKNRLGIDQPVVGFVPLTPFSALPIVPLATLEPLRAKHCWIAINVGLLGCVITLLHSASGLALRRVVMLVLLTLPIHHNLVLGQTYILLLAILTLSFWFYLHDHRTSAGVLMGAAFGLKIFPIFFALYFLRKHDWRALIGLLLGAVAVVTASVMIFGVDTNRVYALQVLPWALRGEALDPYNLHANSIASILHRMFIFEPKWNPQPLWHAPQVVAVLQPLLQLVVFAPSILLSLPRYRDADQIRLEWSALLIALLTISTSPAFYDLAILAMPAVLISSVLVTREQWRLLAMFVALYLAVCFPFSGNRLTLVRSPLLSTPRLFLLILLCAFCYALLRRGTSALTMRPRERRAWAVGIAVALVGGIASNLWHERGIYEHYQSRIPTSRSVFACNRPLATNSSVLFSAMLSDGYRIAQIDSQGFSVRTSKHDEMASTGAGATEWTEISEKSSSVISRSTGTKAAVEIRDAELPLVSPDSTLLAFLRSESGRRRIWIRALSGPANERPITTPDMDVMEFAFRSPDTIIFSASSSGPPRLYSTDLAGHMEQLPLGEARYPAVSPDGRWLAFSRLRHGAWNLWIRSFATGDERAITSANCNDIWPAWAPDSRTLWYASDCGRGLWLTALSRQQVLP